LARPSSLGTRGPGHGSPPGLRFDAAEKLLARRLRGRRRLVVLLLSLALAALTVGRRRPVTRPAHRDPVRMAATGSTQSSSSLFVHISARSFARTLRKLRTKRHRPIQGSAWRRRVLSGLWCAVAHCVDSMPSHKKRLSCQWRSPGIDEPTTGVRQATRLQSSAARVIDGRRRPSRGKRLISSSSTPPRTTRDLPRNSQPAGAGDQRPLFSATLLRPWRPAFRPTPLPAEEDW